MTISANWPSPEKPYVPLFPERSGHHVIISYSRPTAGIAPYGVPQLMWWDAENTAWRIMPTGRYEDLAREDKTSKLSYVGPVLTPAQIAEMFADAKEQCAKIAQHVSDMYLERRENCNDARDLSNLSERVYAATTCADYIRAAAIGPQRKQEAAYLCAANIRNMGATPDGNS